MPAMLRPPARWRTSSSGCAPRVAWVERWMTLDPVTIGPDATAGEALDLMLKGGFRHLPVEDGGAVIGVISMRDVAKSTTKDR